jgi:hypothetical protein
MGVQAILADEIKADIECYWRDDAYQIYKSDRVHVFHSILSRLFSFHVYV